MLVLDGNNPRFPWEPSTTMLTYRLGGTTEASASYRDGHHHPDPSTTSPLKGHNGRAPHTSSLAPASTQRCSTLLTWIFDRALQNAGEVGSSAGSNARASAREVRDDCSHCHQRESGSRSFEEPFEPFLVPVEEAVSTLVLEWRPAIVVGEVVDPAVQR